MAFFDSDIVQEEAKRLFSDYQQLMQLGSDYGVNGIGVGRMPASGASLTAEDIALIVAYERTL